MKIETIIMQRTPSLSGKAKEYSRGYRKIALVDIDRELLNNLERSEPKMISERSLGVLKIRRCRSLYYGKGIRSEGLFYLKHLEGLAEKINSERKSN